MRFLKRNAEVFEEAFIAELFNCSQHSGFTVRIGVSSSMTSNPVQLNMLRLTPKHSGWLQLVNSTVGHPESISVAAMLSRPHNAFVTGNTHHCHCVRSTKSRVTNQPL